MDKIVNKHENQKDWDMMSSTDPESDAMTLYAPPYAFHQALKCE